GIVDREPVRNVAAGAVDEQGDGPIVVACELAETLDAGARRVFLDIPDQVDVAEAITLFFPQLGAHRIDELGDQAIAQLSHPSDYRIERESQPDAGTK